MKLFSFVLAAAAVLGVGGAGVLAAPVKPTETVKMMPPAWKEIPAADEAEIRAGVARLGNEIDALRSELREKPRLASLLPDVQIYHNAIRYPRLYDEILDVAKAKAALAEGLDRARQLRVGKPTWVSKSGPRGYLSRIDGSVQPYILVAPLDFKMEEKKPARLDLFCHGRDEGLTELRFLSGKAETLPAGADKLLVLLYGRYCNANKFAGEIDCFEAIDDVKKRHPIDDNRIILTGFSMGGGAAWHFTVHYADRWAATSPGAGFAESPIFMGMDKNGELDRLPAYQKKLLHWYDCTDWAADLSDVPCIAYAGELDGQILASNLMEKAAAAEGVKLERLIGPQTKHQYEPATKKELDRRLDAYAAKGRNPMPSKVRLETWTLRYNRMFWVYADALEHHWDRARIDAELTGDGISAKTENLTALTFSFPAGHDPFVGKAAAIEIDGVKISVAAKTADEPWTAHFTKTGGAWTVGGVPADGLRKRSGLQGPIDDAFMDSFLIVEPTGKSFNEKTGAWVTSELHHAIDAWRRTFRGEARVRSADEVTDADIAANNLVLWGDPASNKILARIADKLPLKWTSERVAVGGKIYPADHHVPILIYPNPLNPQRYVVLNSGFTFRESSHSSNARQIPMLPDYAIVDIDEPPSAAAPGKIVEADFFGERWELPPGGK